MRIHGLTIPSPALTAGREAMVGTFTSAHISSAVQDQLGASFLSGMPSGWTPYSLASEIANRLLKSERRAGRVIYDAKTRTWEVR